MQPVEPIHTLELFPELIAELLSLLRNLSPLDWEKETVCAGWSVKDVAAHLLGGPADVFVVVKSASIFTDVMTVLWNYGMPYHILGGGSNVLISDKGVREVVVLNKAKEVQFETGDSPTVWCEAGVVFSNLANRCASKGLAGLEWAATVPGTVGGAVYGNAGAFGGDMSANLIWADVLTKNGREKMSVEQMGRERF